MNEPIQNGPKEYEAPVITFLGGVTELTEGLGSPNVEGAAGSGKYYNANPPGGEDDESEEEDEKPEEDEA